MSDSICEKGPFYAISTAVESPVPGSVMDLSGTLGDNVSYVVQETSGVHPVSVAIQFSNDLCTWIDLVGPLTCAPGQTIYLGQSADVPRYCRLAIMDLVSGQHGSIQGSGYAH